MASSSGWAIKRMIRLLRSVAGVRMVLVVRVAERCHSVNMESGMIAAIQRRVDSIVRSCSDRVTMRYGCIDSGSNDVAGSCCV